MLWLLVFGLIVACVLLFQRLQRAEERIGHLEERQSEQTWRILALAAAEREQGEAESPSAPPEPDPQPEPEGEPAAPAPAVTLRSWAEPVATAEVEERRQEEEHDPAPVEALDDESTSPCFSFDFEEIFGRRLPIWAGGITLAVAGVFLVRYSIEAGLLTPLVRVAMSFFFGLALLAGAEAAYRFEDRVRDERVRQALAGAGLATLYAAFYLAGTQYELIGQTVAFLGLASVTALAIFLSYRFGLPSAVLGLVGGFAAPALVGGEDANLPMLALYLALVTGGLTQTANRQKRSWLGLGALAGGLGWGALLLLGGDYDMSEIVALGLYFVLLGALVPAFLDIDRLQQPVRLAAAGAAGLQLAVLVDKGGYQPLAWGLYLLLGAALAWFGWRRPEMRAGSAMAAAIGIALLALWPSPEPLLFALVAAAVAGLFTLVPLALIRWKDGGALQTISIAAASLAIGIVVMTTFGAFDVDGLHMWEAVGLLALALPPSLAARELFTRPATGELAANLTSAGLILILASACLLPDTFVPIAASAIAIGLTWLLREKLVIGRSLKAVVWLFAVIPAITLTIADTAFTEFNTISSGVEALSILSALRWLAAVLPFAAIALLGKEGNDRSMGELLAGFLLFGAMAQLLPPIALVWVAAALAVAIFLRLSERGLAALALTGCISLWAIMPAGQWLEEALLSLAGEPMLASYLPPLRDMFGFVLPLAIALGAARVHIRNLSDRPVPLFWLAIPLAGIVAHSVFKQLFSLEGQPDFAVLGLAERTVWQGLLLAAGWCIWTKLRSAPLASVPALAALVHFGWYTLLLHNPLWAHQAVGQVPIANLVLAAYGVAIAALLSLRKWWPAWRRAFDIAIMLLSLIGAISLLRQMFAGTFLDTLPMSQSEDLLRSLVGILLAIAFLLIGSAREERIWRMGSLVLMIGTVLKVFIFDTAGLEGLLRVASFVALGGSLMGIGWFYSRQLKAGPKTRDV
ncbi:DUF2339 domain-containing protein [Qipengyuania vesicularis]|uniref:DUF2339 domain-containing protein n=1 Tax=Qipengyuania vesicularis TaxID=2867232 RepID=UPI001C86FCC4|nr:DUF2339 domain-containing protein [Qipengyuania vesicularis]MBX7527647.1 DUF2339 domain-containing protein [Qipengyuania vesicularis]